ncbi:MAG: hypothetical protein FWE67_05235 [Planctomycetaceae bacterium]|nr:hypothetical protein [Planctomycetaceae bacterium]
MLDSKSLFGDELLSSGCPLSLTTLPHAIAFGDVFVNGDDGVVGKAGVKKDRSSAFGEGLFTIGAIQKAGVFRAVSGTNADIFFAANTVFGAVFILTAKVFQIVHDYLYKKITTKMKEGKS